MDQKYSGYRRQQRPLSDGVKMPFARKPQNAPTSASRGRSGVTPTGSPSATYAAASNGGASSFYSNPTVSVLLDKVKDGFNEMVLLDWSRNGSTTGRHVDFGDCPDTPGSLLRHIGPLGASNSTVTEVDCCGTRLAKKAYDVGKLNGRREEDVIDKRKEVEVLKRLRHHHVIELVGSFTYGHPGHLEVLFWPVAVCSFEEFFDAIDTVGNYICQAMGADPARLSVPQDSQLDNMVDILFEITQPSGARSHMRLADILDLALRRLFGSFGCLAEAISYIHGQDIRHKDLKPSNILIYPNRMTHQPTSLNSDAHSIVDGIRITDFDAAKDTLGCTVSTTIDPYGTPAYLPPECTRGMRRSSRPGDIFSLGCVFVEMLAVATSSALLPQHHSASSTPSYRPRQTVKKARPYYLHLTQVIGSMDALVGQAFSGIDNQLVALVRGMLASEPEERPIASQVLFDIAAIDKQDEAEDDEHVPYRLFGGCCQSLYKNVPHQQVAVPPPPQGPVICRNQFGQRIDEAPTFDEGDIRTMEDLNKEHRFCQNYYLLGRCERDCNQYEHEMKLDERQLALLRATKRRIACRNGVDCSLPACFFGHNCPYMRAGTAPNERTQRHKCYRSGPRSKNDCPFPNEAHDMDLTVTSHTYFDG